MNPPHTQDMTLDDARECIRQADEFGWKGLPGPGNGAEKPRVIIVGGEPTLHPKFMEFVKLARSWTGTYVEVYSNGHTEESRQLLNEARYRYDASINKEGFKKSSRQDATDGRQPWSMETYVSPTEAGLPPTVCYCHSFLICGIGVDASGYSLCPIGLFVSEVLGVEGKTTIFADLYDQEKAYRMTTEMCRHCGYEGQHRYGPTQLLNEFRAYANQCGKINGSAVSPVWQKAFEKYGIME